MTAYVSLFDLLSVGIGPSSSHTVGPMRAARTFALRLVDTGIIDDVRSVTCSLFGSLGATGIGHGTPDAVVAGLEGLDPETCDPVLVHGAWTGLADSGRRVPVGAVSGARMLARALPRGTRETLRLAGTHEITFHRDDIQLVPQTRLPEHPNALTLAAWGDDAETPLLSETYYSIGGGFIRREGEEAKLASRKPHPLPFGTADELLAICARDGIAIDEVAWRNELALHPDSDIGARVDAIWAAMASCVENGLNTPGMLPGPLGVKRRASLLRAKLEADLPRIDRERSGEWLQAFALAVNEENAAGGRVVTAPTNGAAGILPAVGYYYLRFVPGASAEGMRRYLLTATAIGSLFKANASISGAEAGCQGEVGSACAMAAGALCAVLGGTPQQVENAAEIAMEHHLGLTCDPVGGLVQIPCIERNAIASSTAVSAARLALLGDGTHVVSLDTVIETMRQTGIDMSTKYKETSEGGLAVNVIEC
ncbi:L-serine dehydratase [Conyzicola lurida]|uniref:L-serine dehydratase n=1 Tax=Conyzicola lurida TaxID=1172621 RepID=A0A841AK23_9MICO|nr:L-serine ammonia-lyase [Conyzicola lurida]MBB5841799.1 L-serine dehydratase [Conyzicola lurida]